MVKGLASIVIPLYNCGQILKSNIDFFINQTYDQCEYIFIDDCSDDKSYTCIPNHNNIKIIHHSSQRGPGEARNSGLLEAEGEFVFFFDGDDRPSVDTVYECIKQYRKMNTDIIVFNFCDTDKPEKRKNFLLSYAEIPKPITFDSSFEGSVWNKMYLNSIIQNYDIKFAGNEVANEDICFTAEYISHARNVSYIDKSLYTYIINPTSITSNRPTDYTGIMRFINSAYYLDSVGTQKKIDFSIFLHVFAYKCIRMAVRNILNDESYVKKIFRNLLRDERFLTIINRANTNVGQYSNFYISILNGDLKKTYDFIKDHEKNSILNIGT